MFQQQQQQQLTYLLTYTYILYSLGTLTRTSLEQEHYERQLRVRMMGVGNRLSTDRIRRCQDATDRNGIGKASGLRREQRRRVFVRLWACSASCVRHIANPAVAVDPENPTTRRTLRPAARCWRRGGVAAAGSRDWVATARKIVRFSLTTLRTRLPFRNEHQLRAVFR